MMKLFWKRKKKPRVVIVTRSMNPKMYEASQKTITLPYKRVRLLNTSAVGYLRKMLRVKADYIINIDEDAFVTDHERLVGLLNYCIDNNIDMCGLPDGGVVATRRHNPLVVNPFFNIVNVRKLRKSFSRKKLKAYSKHLPEYELKAPPVEMLHKRYEFDNYEPYYPFFFWVSQNFNMLYLGGEDHPDGHTTILHDHEGKPFLEHTWYSRDYGVDKFHTDRINRVIESALGNKWQNSEGR